VLEQGALVLLPFEVAAVQLVTTPRRKDLAHGGRGCAYDADHSREVGSVGWEEREGFV